MEPANPTRRRVIALGGGACNAMNRLVRDGKAAGVDLVAMNTDAQDLRRAAASIRVQLGTTVVRGLGAGGDAEVGQRCALDDSAAVHDAITGASDVVLLVGLGGGTGSGAALPVCDLARDLGVRVRAVVTLPFAFEGRRRARVAAEALERLREKLGADCIVVGEGIATPAGGAPVTMAEQFARLDEAMIAALATLPT
ncbi:MAG: hypothetical protein ACOZNI_28085 [Myxococcota bacterium]